MEFLRHPLYSILAVIIIGAMSGALAHGTSGTWRAPRDVLVAVLVGIGTAFLGFHAAMLSNLATGIILMPFTVALVVSLLTSFALRDRAR
jgi:Na+/pantothenate symporter